jgi:hypothetical protein
MRRSSILGGALAALAFGLPMMAQVVSTPGGVITAPIVLQQSFTTGMVGFTTNQTARLNVFNLNTVPTATPAAATAVQPANCNVELQFFDTKGTEVGHAVVTDFAAGAYASLDLPRTTVTSESTARAEIRGVVLINPTLTPASTITPGFCSVFTTLEVFDANGSTVSLTSDTRAAVPSLLVPAVVSAASIR